MIYQDWEELYDLSQVDVREWNTLMAHIYESEERVVNVLLKLYNFKIVGERKRKKILFLRSCVKYKSNRIGINILPI